MMKNKFKKNVLISILWQIFKANFLRFGKNQ